MASKDLCARLERKYPDFMTAEDFEIRLQDFDDETVISTAKKCASVDDDPFAMLAGLTKLAQDEDTRLHLLGYKNKQEYEVMQHWINTRLKRHTEEMSVYE